MKTFSLRSALRILGLGGILACINLLPAVAQEDMQHYVSEYEYIIDLNQTGGNEGPDKLILVFDTTTLTFEFSEQGRIAMTSPEGVRYAARIRLARVADQTSYDRNATPSDSEIFRILNEEAGDEPEMELKEWMLKPSEWLPDK